MSWQDRKQTATLEVGNGDIFTIDFVEVSGARQERASVFSFSEYSGDFVQRLSSGGSSYKIDAIFSGENQDTEANDFEVATLDNRPMYFTHPFKGRRKVQLISIERVDNPTTSANITVFSLSLHETLESILPVSSEVVATTILERNFEKEIACAEDFESTIVSIPETQYSLLQTVAQAQASFEKYFSLALDKMAEFEQIRLTAISAIATIESSVSSAVLAVQKLIAFPSKVIAFLSSKLAYYRDLLGFGETISDDGSYQLVQSSAIIGECLSLSSAGTNDFLSRREVFDIADSVLAIYDAYTIRMDSTDVQNREVHGYLYEIVALSMGSLSGVALGAKQERQITTTAKTDLYMLAYKLYSPRQADELDDYIRQLVDVNQIKGDEIFELEIGRKILYYV